MASGDGEQLAILRPDVTEQGGGGRGQMVSRSATTYQRLTGAGGRAVFVHRTKNVS